MRESEHAPESIAVELSGPQRALIRCLGLGTDWRKAGVKPATVQLAIMRNLVQRDSATSQLLLTDQGRAVLAVLSLAATLASERAGHPARGKR